MKENPLLEGQDDFKVKTRDSRAVKLLTVLVALAALYTFYLAQSLLIPIVFSALVALLLSPLVTRCKRWHVPRSLSAIVLLSMLVTPVSLLVIELSEPIERWMGLLPQLSAEVTEQIDEINDTLDENVDTDNTQGNNSSNNAFVNWLAKGAKEAQSAEESAVEEQLKRGGTEVILAMLIATPIFLAQVLGSFVLILFLLIFGPPLFKVFVSDFPIIKNKHRAKFLIKSIQQALSKYIVTISLINTGLGVFTAVALTVFNVRDAILWGALVGLLNFVPYVGSILSLAILSLVGLVQFGLTATALLPSGIFLIFNIIESQIVTPAVLGKSMQINPLIIILWLLLMGWLWGVLGVLLAVPLFVCIKLALEQMEIFPHWLKLIEATDSE